MSKENEKLGVAMAGAGLIGLLHAASMKTAIETMDLPAEMVTVCDVEAEKAKAYKDLFGFRQCGTDPFEAIADPAVDAVFVCTWTSEHRALVEEAVRQGKHVFCEKPLAFNAAEARAMQAAVEGAGLMNQVGLVLRQGPVWNVLRHELSARDAGFPITFIFRDDQCFPIKGGHPSLWRKDPNKAGAGALIEHSIHDLDLLEWIFGPAASVRAFTAERFGHRGIEDLARVDIRFGSGMEGTLVSVWHDVVNRHSNRRFEVFHEKLFMALESEYIGPISFMEGEGQPAELSTEEVNNRFFDIRGLDDPRERDLAMRFGAYEDYLFLKSAIEGTPAEHAPGFKEAVRAHELVDACYLSAREGREVFIEDWPARDVGRADK